MRRTALLIAKILSVGAVSLVALPRANACTCLPPGPVAHELANNGSVFEGRVIRLLHEPKQYRITATLEVLRRWKGSSEKRVDVVTLDQGSLCGFEFKYGKRYLLFTHEAEGTLSVSLCSRSKPSSDAADDIALLNQLSKSGGSRTDDDAAPPTPAPVEPADAGAEALTAPEASAPRPADSVMAPSGTAGPNGARGGCASCAVAPQSTESPAPLVAAFSVFALFFWRRSRVEERAGLGT